MMVRRPISREDGQVQTLTRYVYMLGLISNKKGGEKSFRRGQVILYGRRRKKLSLPSRVTRLEHFTP